MIIGNACSLLKSPVVWVLILLLLALGKVGMMDLEDVVQRNSTYCEMVDLYEASNGETGWPAYKEEGTCP